MKKKITRRAPPRYLITWRNRKTLGWRQRTYARRPKHLDFWLRSTTPIRCEDLLTGEIIATNFGLREAAFFSTHDWPKRASALRAIKRFYAPKPAPLPRGIVLAGRIAHLRELEKNWLRKLRTAQTKLKKLRAAIRRAEKRSAELCQTTPNPPPCVPPPGN